MMTVAHGLIDTCFNNTCTDAASLAAHIRRCHDDSAFFVPAHMLSGQQKPNNR